MEAMGFEPRSNYLKLLAKRAIEGAPPFPDNSVNGDASRLATLPKFS
jgi:hypothetical protein